MTTIFAFKAKNAWVLVADRFATEQVSLSRDQFNGRPYQTLLVNVDKKIFSKNTLVFSGCGDQETITQLVIELSENCSTLDQCRNHIITKLDDDWFKINIVDRPHLLIISRSEQKCLLVDFKLKNHPDKIKDITQFIVLGGGERSLYVSLVKREIMKFFDVLIEDSRLTAVQCAKWLDTLWLGSHKDDLKLTGPPSFIGCDVCIARKDDSEEINVQPKNYEIV